MSNDRKMKFLSGYNIKSVVEGVGAFSARGGGSPQQENSGTDTTLVGGVYQGDFPGGEETIFS